MSTQHSNTALAISLEPLAPASEAVGVATLVATTTSEELGMTCGVVADSSEGASSKDTPELNAGSHGRYLPDRTEPIRWTTHCIGSLLKLLTPILTPTRATTRLVSEGLDLLPNPSHWGNFSFSDLSRAWWSHCLIEPRA
ncbi:hypothetical protein E4T56_gene5583 [Termitomyces sp. T112]|nr:hypothetical protein E4T56_gene5583 [Termitomyces sp. T112]